MNGFADSLQLALGLILSGDAELWAIVGLSLRVSLTAVAIAALVGMPLGAMLAVTRFAGRKGVIVLINALMGLPPVVVGLAVYLMLSASGPLGVLQLLYTPTAMIIAQVVLVAPIITALSRQVVEDMHAEYADYLGSFGMRGVRTIPTLLWEGRFGLTTALLAGVGRAIAEVGAVMIVGGNINHVTRVMTTTIALETSKGDLGMALALGVILIGLAISVNALIAGMTQASARQSYA